MGHVYWEKPEIPIPQNAYIDHSDGRVLIFLSNDLPTRQSDRRTIGHATSEGTMHPNENFRYYYPNLWKQYYGNDDIREHYLSVGMYALTLGIGYKTQLYPLLQKTYGPLYANFLMDYSMYSILDRSDAAINFQERMKKNVLFSRDAKSDTWISDVFTRRLTENMNTEFTSLWLQQCKSIGVTQAWICIDGSNNDCDAKECELAEPGYAKSGTSGNIVSYMYAVTDKGLPLTYIVYNGSKVDSVAFQRMAHILSDHGLEVKGIIADRGFCTHAVVETLNKQSFPYVLMLTSNVEGYRKMAEKHKEDIRWNVKNSSGKEALFGISEKRRIFKEYPEEAYITLFYDGMNAAERMTRLMENVNSAIDKLKAAAAMGEVKAVPKNVKKYVEVKQVGEKIEVVCDYDKWQEDLYAKGYWAIASSIEFTPRELDHIYHLRDASETQYSILKTQLGYDVTRAHSTEAIRNKYASCFIASIIRYEIMDSCQRMGEKTNRMIRELESLSLDLSLNGDYHAIHTESAKAKRILSYYDILPEDLEFIANDVNIRLSSSIVSQTRPFPSHEGPKARKKGRPAKEMKDDPGTVKPKRGRGRPKGSKNKKTLEREAAEQTESEKTKRGPGRPKGSKNKEKEDNASQPKRGRGRPKGSKDKAPRKSKTRTQGTTPEPENSDD